jgi:hypothetical protein
MEIEEILRNDPMINEFLQKNQFAEGRIFEAAKQLAKEEDVLKSIRKILCPLAERVINIFVSYNHKDEDTAKIIVEQLRLYSANKLNIHYMADNPKRLVGKEWRKWIKEKIAISNWFLLLLPDPSDDWDWCLFETGLFEKDVTSADRLICIHHPLIKLPDPIDDYHAVPAKQNEVEQFLMMVFIEENPIPGMRAINPNFEKDLKKTAKIIVDAIVPPRKFYRDIFEPWVEFMHDDIDNVKNISDLDKSHILTINQKALELFDYHIRPDDFATLRRGLPTESDQYWYKELAYIVEKIAEGRNFFPISGVIKAKNGKTYKPVLCSIDRLVNQKGPISSLHLIFIEEVSTVDGSVIPQKLLCLATLLRYAFRFRWEVLEKFCAKEMVETDVTKLKNALLRIKRDWETKGVGGKDYVLQFYPEKEHENISNMYDAWRELSTPDNHGKLDIAIKNKDLKMIPKLLDSVLPINQQFLEMTVHYFSQEVSGSK